MVDLLGLPEAALAHITTFLEVGEMLELSQCCKFIRAFMTSNDELLWGPRCKEFGIENLTEWKCSLYQNLYAGLLHPYAAALGVWTAKAPPYGCVVVVHLQPPAIVGSCLASKKMNGPLFLRPLFRIQLVKDGSPRVSCLRSKLQQAPTPVLGEAATEHARDQSKQHDAQLEFEACHKSFTFTCCKACKQDEVELEFRKHTHVPQGMYEYAGTGGRWQDEPETPEVVDPEPEDDMQMVLQMINQAMIDHYRRGSDPTVLQLSRLQLPQVREHSLEGVWKGTYGSHGIEAVLVKVEGGNLIGTKLTGDYNVPAGELTFRADLSSMDTSPAGTRFVLPSGYTPRVKSWQLAESQLLVQAKYAAEGQVARPGFASPAFIKADLLHFSNECFGILWHSIGTFSLFKRLPLDLS